MPDIEINLYQILFHISYLTLWLFGRFVKHESDEDAAGSAES